MPAIIYPPQLQTKDQLGSIKIFVVLDKPDQQLDWLSKGIKQNRNDFVITVRRRNYEKKDIEF